MSDYRRYFVPDGTYFFTVVCDRRAPQFSNEVARRIVGAVAGGAMLGVVSLGVVALCEALEWWQFAFTWTPYFLLLL